MVKDKILILIPARYESSRFPGKPLAMINGQSMIERVSRACQFESTEFHFESVVVTDDERIEKLLKEKGLEVVRVDDEVASGSERCYLAYERFFQKKSFDFLINVQGDEPLIEHQLLVDLVGYHQSSSFEIATVIKKMAKDDGFNDVNKVKAVVCEKSGQCLYFSRTGIPHDRDGENEKIWNLHVGIYSYRPKALELFCKNGPSPLERIEKLEQLRALEMGMKIGAIDTQTILQGVDTPRDITLVEGVLREREGQ